MEADAVVKPRVLFCSYHHLLDSASGAAVCTRDLWAGLAERGWACGVLCGPDVDTPRAEPLTARLARSGLAVQTRQVESGPLPFELHHTPDRGVPVSIFDPATPRPAGTPPTPEEGDAFLSLFQGVCDRFRPDVIWTYGGHALAQRVMRAARERGLRVVFALHNFDYHGRDLFRLCDAVLVPSEFAQRHYRQTLRLESVAIPGPWDWSRVLCSGVEGQYVTFVNPVPQKGVFWLARLIEVLAHRRPDIPFLIVEGRGGVDWLGRCGVDLAGVTTVSRMKNTPDPRHFYTRTKLIVMPSLWRESYPRVPVEAAINGIPTIGSNRGGLPETLAECGIALPIPDRYTPTTRTPPTAEEVAPWVETIVRLWDDAHAFAREQTRCRVASLAWQADELLPRFEQFLHSVMSQTAPPPISE